jgi:cell wall-associated NlpC family hydrolase
VRGDLVAREVELWDRTPFHEQQATRGRGTDCKGLVWGVARDLGFPEADSFYATFIHYDLKKRRGLPHELLLEGMAALFDRVEDIRPGDILLLKVEALNHRPAHLAIASRNEGRAWHAQIAPNAFVKEASLRSLLKKCPLHSVWRWRNV